MADTSAMAEIRGIDIKKLVEGFAEEGIILKNYCRVMPCSAREIRYYAKTAGFLTGPTTTGITASQIANTSSKSLPVAIEPSYTRSTAYVKKYFASSPLISIEDLKDCDPDIWGDMIRDAVRAVNYQIDARIQTVMTAAGAGTGAATGNGWNVDADGDPITDFENAKLSMRTYGYDTSDMVAYMDPINAKWLIRWLINVKGSSIPNFSSDKVGSGKLMELLGCKIVVSQNATADQVTFFIPNKAVVWKEFMPTQTAVINDEGIGKTVRVWAEGEAIRPNPYAVYVLTDVIN
jgi:hypothetical protein